MNEILGPYAGTGPANGFRQLTERSPRPPLIHWGYTPRTAAVMKDCTAVRTMSLEGSCEKIADLTISQVLKSPTLPRVFSVNYPLHKGADGWMSEKQFQTFYWPFSESHECLHQ
jgi:hypothetical protein